MGNKFSDIYSKANYLLIWGFVLGLYFTHVLIQVAAFSYLLILIYQVLRRKNHSWQFFHYLVFAYLVSAVIAYLISGISFKKGIQHLLPHIVLLSVVPATLWAQAKKTVDIKPWILAMIAFAGAVALVGWVEHFQGVERATGFYSGYFGLASLMAWSIPITAGLFLSRKSQISWALLPLLVFELIALWWTFTRSAFLALTVAIFSWWGLRLRDHFRNRNRIPGAETLRWLGILTIPLLLAVLSLNTSDSRLNPLQSHSPNGETAETPEFSSGRLSIIQDATGIIANEIKDHDYKALLLGQGLSSRARLVDSPFTSWESDYLQVFMNQGLLGLGLIIIIYVHFLKLIRRGLNTDNCLLNGIAAAGIVMVVMSFLTIPLTGFIGAAAFVLIYFYLSQGVINEADDG